MNRIRYPPINPRSSASIHHSESHASKLISLLSSTRLGFEKKEDEIGGERGREIGEGGEEDSLESKFNKRIIEILMLVQSSQITPRNRECTLDISRPDQRTISPNQFVSLHALTNPNSRATRENSSIRPGREVRRYETEDRKKRHTSPQHSPQAHRKLNPAQQQQKMASSCPPIVCRQLFPLI